VLEADIASCFDEIDHTALMGRVRGRISDKRVLGLVKAFLKAGVLDESALVRNSVSGTPQGGILSPLLANIACRSSMTTSRPCGRPTTTTPPGSGIAAAEERPIGWSDTPTTSW
jgi:hypothetical protein